MSGPRREHISSGGPWERSVGYSRVVVVDDRAWVAGTTGTAPDGTVPKDVAEQAELAIDVIDTSLAAAGMSVIDVVACRIYLLDFADWERIQPVFTRTIGPARPALTTLQIAGLIHPDHRLEIEVEAVRS